MSPVVEGETDSALFKALNTIVSRGRRLTEESARADMLAVIVDASDDAVYRWDANGTITRWNPAAERLFGYTAEEIVGRPVSELGPPDTSNTCDEIRSRVLLGERITRREVEGITKDRTRFWVTLSMAPIVTDGVIVGGAVIARDLTALKRTDDALAEARESYRALFENAADAIVVIDCANLAILDANRTASSLFGYSREELRGMRITDISDEPEVTAESVKRDDVRVPKRRLRRKDGTTLFAEISASMMRYFGRSARVAFIRDITARVQVEDALAASEGKFAAAFAASPDAVNISSIADGRVVEVNKGFTALTGYTAADVVGKSAVDLRLWADDAVRDHAVAMLSEKGGFDDYEAAFRRKNGTTFPALASARVIEIEGIPHILSVTRDISERKLAARELERSNERLAEMVRDITATLGRVVEIRDPYTHGHQERVALVCRAMAEEMGLPADETEVLEMAAVVHDVGKLAIPAEILNKPGILSAVEFGLIKAHSERGHAILQGINFGSPVADIVLQHHERADGSGYPAGLSGEEILPAARILAIADVVEAMASYRPYRPALGLDVAIAEIRDHPQQFDPAASAACLRLYERGELAYLEEPVSE